MGPAAAALKLQVLNAKPENVDREGEVVAMAGRLGRVTVATNMAGRGTDILLVKKYTKEGKGNKQRKEGKAVRPHVLVYLMLILLLLVLLLPPVVIIIPTFLYC